MRIGILGVGNMGKQFARLAVAHGHHVLLANSRTPDTVPFDIRYELGDNLTSATAAEVARGSDLVIVALPVKNYSRLPAAELAGKIVIDAGNYYVERDGEIPELEDKTSSEFLQGFLPKSIVVKAFNHLRANELTEHAQEPSTPNRRALAIATDDPAAGATVATLMDEFGFDPLEIGPLGQGWQVQPGNPAYIPRFTTQELAVKIGEATQGGGAADNQSRGDRGRV
jgi:8-hydroxy-5-deazaflavin:NADPH oxidoreductase